MRRDLSNLAVESLSQGSPLLGSPLLGALLLGALSSGLVACGGDGGGKAERSGTRRDVVAVTSAPARWLVELSGVAAPAEVVAAPGSHPGDWRPDDAALDALVSARKVLLVSEEFEPWTQRAGLPPSRTVELVDLAPPGTLIGTEGVQHSHGAGPAHSHGGIVGTVWTDPELLEALPRAVAEALGGEGKAARDVPGLAEYRAALEALGKAAKGRALIATDHGLEYIGRAAGLEVRVALLECNGEGPTNERGVLQAQAFSEKSDDAGLLVWLDEEPNAEFSATAKDAFGLRSVPFSLGATPGSDVLPTLTGSVNALAAALAE